MTHTNYCHADLPPTLIRGVFGVALSEVRDECTWGEIGVGEIRFSSRLCGWWMCEEVVTGLYFVGAISFFFWVRWDPSYG